jgi:hypothetical protein
VIVGEIDVCVAIADTGVALDAALPQAASRIKTANTMAYVVQRVDMIFPLLERFECLNPIVHDPLQDLQGHRTMAQDHVVKGLDVELVAEPVHSPLAQF